MSLWDWLRHFFNPPQPPTQPPPPPIPVERWQDRVRAIQLPPDQRVSVSVSQAATTRSDDSLIRKALTVGGYSDGSHFATNSSNQNVIYRIKTNLRRDLLA